ncbi:hypothetical protein [Microvirga soli]|uniref:hypothetical protein n=1 Tax=Microvirga soli TaxID=1854496 RepID=UPI00191E4B5E|nr:hypothetical protein [Microvirga soli]
MTQDSFRSWRITTRNFIDYQRRKCPLWKSVGLYAWLTQDGTIRGVINLGSLASTEILASFSSRWPTVIEAIEPKELRAELYAIVHPSVISTGPGFGRRYQSMKLAIHPCRRDQLIAQSSGRSSPRYSCEPMPVLI